jgi:hypothetical protein
MVAPSGTPARTNLRMTTPPEAVRDCAASIASRRLTKSERLPTLQIGGRMNKLTLASEAGAFSGSLIGAIVFVLLWPGPLYPDNRVLATIPVAVAIYAFNGFGRLAWWGIQRLRRR